MKARKHLSKFNFNSNFINTFHHEILICCVVNLKKIYFGLETQWNLYLRILDWLQEK